MKELLTLSKTLILILSTNLLFSLIPYSLSCQEWFDTDWAFRNEVDISNPGGSVLTDFQVQISLDDTFDFANANNDGSEIRMTQADGITPIPYWIESWDVSAEEASVWCNIPVIPGTGTMIYLYYGNAAAADSSNGSATFRLFDDFENSQVMMRNWVRTLNWTGSGWSGFVPHDWKYSMIMQEGALYYSFNRRNNGWSIESLDDEITDEFEYIHTQVNPDGSVNGMTTSNQYEYGVLLSGLGLGYRYFKNTDSALAMQCYNDMKLVYGLVKNHWESPGYGNNFSMTLRGFVNSCKAFNEYGDLTMATEAETIVGNFGTTFITHQNADGSWNVGDGSYHVQTQLKRNFATLWAYDITGEQSYLDAVKNNIEWILTNRWVASNGGLTWSTGNTWDFYECHQMWFMISVRMLYDRSGGTYDFLTNGEMAWHFLTDNNWCDFDVYVHNYENHGAFFSYRETTSYGTYQTTNSWKGSYEIGAALWGMSLNYQWLSNYQSSHSSQPYNYLDEMVKQIKNAPSGNGYYSEDSFAPDLSKWNVVGSPAISVVEENGDHVLSMRGNQNHNDLIVSIDQGFDDFILEADVKMTANGNELSNPEVDFRYSDLDNRYLTIMRGENINDLYMRRYENGSQFINTGYPFFYNTDYYKYKIIANGSNIKLYLDDNMLSDYTDSGTGILSGAITLHNYRSSYAAYFDDIRIREITDPEPVSLLGAQESLKFLDLKVYLEGPFNGNSMNTDLSVLPVNQPYNTVPWYYSGTETLTEIPPDAVDWVLIELRDAPDAASATPATIIGRQAAIILSNGSINAADGSSFLQFKNSVTQQLFVIIHHRNHLAVMSASALPENPDRYYSWDFTNSASQAYGNSETELENGNFGMFGGDINSDGIVDFADHDQSWTQQAGLSGYLNTDTDLNGQVNNPDKNNLWFKNFGLEAQVPQ